MGTPSPLDIAQGSNLPTDTGIKLACDNTACAVGNALIVLALSGLTGVKAFIPIFIVALASKLEWDFPLELSNGSWLSDWPAIIGLGTFLFIETVLDCFPGCDELQDAVMLILKPVLAIVLAISPMYGEAGSTQELGFQIFTAINSGLISEVMALVKGLETIAVDASSAGFGAPIRSLLEDVCIVVAAFFVLTIGAVVAGVVLFILTLCVVCWIIRRKSKGKSIIPSCWCCPGCHGDEDSQDEDPEHLGARFFRSRGIRDADTETDLEEDEEEEE